MSYTAIQVEHIGKLYHIGETIGSYDTLRERIMQQLTAPFQGNKRRKTEIETFWALKDINFSVEEGEVVGIIGRNGAGKSTMLKILSRITEPTEGRVRLRGRVGTLLEVGTGFNPELTGRENTYLNGAILGMTRREIDRKFDEIVNFAGIERFMDTPVKRYSSGMFIRLAFAVAAHLETDILLVDEVLAVGDIAFQQKCLGKMSDVAQAGRTVLFISHNMQAVQNLCPRTIFLDNGQVVADGDTNTILAQYVESLSQIDADIAIEDIPRELEHLGQDVRITDVKVYNSQQQPTNVIMRGEEFEVEITCRVLNPIDESGFMIGFNSAYDERILTATGFESGAVFSGQPGQIIKGRLRISHIAFTSGRYYLTAAVVHHTAQGLDRLPRVFTLDVSEVQADHKFLRRSGYLMLNNPNWTLEIAE